MIKIDTKELNRLAFESDKMAKEIHGIPMKKVLRLALSETGKESKEHMQDLIENTPRASYFYKRKGGRVHFPSKPGYPPAIEYGKLYSNLSYRTKVNLSYGQLEIGVASTVPYAKFVELREDNLSYRRPFIKPTMDDTIMPLHNKVRQLGFMAIQRAVKRGES